MLASCLFLSVAVSQCCPQIMKMCHPHSSPFQFQKALYLVNRILLGTSYLPSPTSVYGRPLTDPLFFEFSLICSFPSSDCIERMCKNSTLYLTLTATFRNLITSSLLSILFQAWIWDFPTQCCLDLSFEMYSLGNRILRALEMWCAHYFHPF